MIRKNIKFLIIPIIALLLQYCAQPGSLTGGAKDTEPPRLTKSYPAVQQRNIKPKKIVISFDEYLNLDNIQGKFLSSPPLLVKPKIDMKGKSIVIKLKEELRDSVTYTFTFQDAVQDYHENNAIEDFRFVFSTGNSIDSLAASGRLLDAFTQTAVKDAFVMLYDINSDSIPYQEAPLYIARTDSSGRFTVDYIRSGKYKVFAISDIDQNYKYSLPYEQIAFIDTLIYTRAERILQSDTIKAGTILDRIMGSDTLSSDTLRNDTVLSHFTTKYYPDNLNLFLFEEDSKKQFIETYSRTMKGKLTFAYAKLPDSVKIEALNFNLNQARIERTDTGRYVTFWLPPTEEILQDSLSLRVFYTNKDSLENIVNEEDTIHFRYETPKDSLKVKRLKISYGITDHKHTEPFEIQFDAPIDSLYLERLTLSEIIDTLVHDAKKQALISAFRPDNSTLIFAFKRPLVKDLNIRFLDSLTAKSVTELKHSPNRDTVVCNLTNKELALKETLKIRVEYDNDFYLNQIQKFADTVSLFVTGQAVTHEKRIHPDTLELEFSQPLRTPPNVELLGFTASDFKNIYSPYSTKYKIALLTKNLIETDTIDLQLSTAEGDSADVKSRNFEYKTTLIYKPIPQGVEKSERTASDKFYIQMMSPHYQDLKLEAINPTLSGTWYKQSGAQDSLAFSFSDAAARAEKKLKVALTYTFKNARLKYETRTDTLILERKEISNRKNSGRNTDGKISVKVEVPVEYKLSPDSTRMRSFFINYAWKPGFTYLLNSDSLAFTDMFGRTNTESESRISVRKEESYSELSLTISYVGLLNSEKFFAPKTSTLDSANFTSLNEGQVMVQLINSKKIIVEEIYLKTDSTLNFKHLIPDKYTLKFIYDKNSDGKFSTGIYLKKIQPERVLLIPEPIELKAKDNKELNFKMLFYNYY